MKRVAIATSMVCSLTFLSQCSSRSGSTYPSPEKASSSKEVCDDSNSANSAANAKGLKQVPKIEIKLKDYDDRRVRVTWYDDVLPILTSTIPGEKYQCVTCHTDYGEPKTLKKIRPGGLSEVGHMVASMREGGQAFMPRIGDRVPDRYVTMLKTWEANPELGQASGYDKTVRQRQAEYQRQKVIIEQILDENAQFNEQNADLSLQKSGSTCKSNS
jgi:hypothetical protein